ncbi:MAG: efflux RND transporter periplasmic adaptor subunit [Alphaproteobacteria bacterium]|nr:efflux RND transporter periplasmic adaptor subunit [Alphaproteobacteria bacterium]
MWQKKWNQLKQIQWNQLKREKWEQLKGLSRHKWARLVRIKIMALCHDKQKMMAAGICSGVIIIMAILGTVDSYSRHKKIEMADANREKQVLTAVEEKTTFAVSDTQAKIAQPQSASETISPTSAKASAPSAPALIPVEEPLTAVIVPSIESSVASEISGRVNNIAVKEGQGFKQGDILLSFDCAMNEAVLARAKADLKAGEASFNAKTKLKELGSASDLEVTLADADFDRAKADVMKASAVVDHCKIVAPYDGAVVDISVHPYDTVKEGQAIMKLIAFGAPEVELLVPSDKLINIQKGGVFSLNVEETGRKYPGSITNVVPRIDPVSQMFKVTGVLKEGNYNEGIVPGMTGTATLVK